MKYLYEFAKKKEKISRRRMPTFMFRDWLGGEDEIRTLPRRFGSARNFFCIDAISDRY